MKFASGCVCGGHGVVALGDYMVSYLVLLALFLCSASFLLWPEQLCPSSPSSTWLLLACLTWTESLDLWTKGASLPLNCDFWCWVQHWESWLVQLLLCLLHIFWLSNSLWIYYPVVILLLIPSVFDNAIRVTMMLQANLAVRHKTFPLVY